MTAWFGRICILVTAFSLFGCAPSHDSYYPVHDTSTDIAGGAYVGTVAGAVGQAALPIVAITGGAVAAVLGNSPKGIIRRLTHEGVQIVWVGQKIRIIIPSDKAFIPTTAKLNYLFYKPLREVALVLMKFHNTPMTVAAYSDNIGYSQTNKKLSYEQAHAIAAYMWAHGVSTAELHPVAESKNFPVARNNRVQGYAYNRRVEITFVNRGLM